MHWLNLSMLPKSSAFANFSGVELGLKKEFFPQLYQIIL